MRIFCKNSNKRCLIFLWRSFVRTERMKQNAHFAKNLICDFPSTRCGYTKKRLQKAVLLIFTQIITEQKETIILATFSRRNRITADNAEVYAH